MYTSILFIGGPYHGTWAAVANGTRRVYRPLLPTLQAFTAGDFSLTAAMDTNISVVIYERMPLGKDRLDCMIYVGN